MHAIAHNMCSHDDNIAVTCLLHGVGDCEDENIAQRALQVKSIAHGAYRQKKWLSLLPTLFLKPTLCY